MRFHNFGKNVRFAPATVIAPRSQEEVAECLRVFRGRRIRAIGSLHSWSEAAVEEDVVLDLRHLNTVTIGVNPDGGLYAEIEAGCTVDRALEYLSTHGGYTLPTYGIIGKQTMAGCIATATHGSGRASLSGHVSAVTVAAYDEAGRARIYRWTEGRELLAARCGVGCSGIVLSVRVPVEPDFLIEEKTEGFPDIEPLLELQSKYPRQQFYLIPWSWKWLAQSRRPRRGPHRSCAACEASAWTSCSTAWSGSLPGICSGGRRFAGSIAMGFQ
jgi:hypothetical protein